MKHNVVLEGYGCRMRPVALEDAEFIVNLRKMPHVKNNVSDTLNTLEKQQNGLVEYFDKKDIYYWILSESETGRLVGTCGLYDINEGSAVPGLWVVFPDAAFSIVAPTLLMYQFAFDRLGLDKLVLNVVASNKKVLKFQRLFGARETHIEKNGQIINGQPVDFVWFEITRQMWPALFEKWNGIIG